MQICRILIESGAELLALNADGNMPYDICDDELTLDYIETQMDRIGITQEMIDQTRAKVENLMLNDLQILVKKRAQTSTRSIDDVLSYRNSDGVTPLHIASANGYQTVVEYLLHQGVSINLQDGDGWTPLHAAAFWCQQAVLGKEHACNSSAVCIPGSFLGQLIEAGADIHEKIPDGRSVLDLCDDPDLRAYMVDFRDQNLRNQEKAAAAAAMAAAQLQQKMSNRLQINTNSLPNGTTARTGTLYESRSSVSSPYGSGSSLNRTSSIRRASIRDREKVKKLNENFLDVLQARDKIQEDNDEGPAAVLHSNGIASSSMTKFPTKEEHTSSVTTGTDSTIREPLSSAPSYPTSLKKSTAPILELTLPPLKVPPPLPPHPPPQSTADTLSDVKRRREERRRGVGGSSSIIPVPITSPQLPPPNADSNYKLTENNNHLTSKISNGTHPTIPSDPLQRYTSPKQVQIKDYHVNADDREKRICCTIL